MKKQQAKKQSEKPQKLAITDEQRDQAARWTVEFEAAEKEVEKWHLRGEKIIKRFKDDRDAAQRKKTRWNIFSSNTQTKQALLYGQMPKVDVNRRFGDSQDDVARVAGVILDRVLNCEVESPTDTYVQALWDALQDLLLPGMGMVRLRYEREEEQIEEEPAVMAEDGVTEIAPKVEAHAKLIEENVIVEYVPWNKHLWSPANRYAQVRWWAFESQMSREQLVSRFPGVGELVPLDSEKRKGSDTEVKSTPWGRADVWEIWDKQSKRVHWFVKGFPRLLDTKDDPLELQGFWPFPRPMFANATTDTLVPTPDFVLAQDLYDEVDDLSTRITNLQKAINVRGAYDGSNKGLQRLLTETASNELVPIENFAAFMEKGGIAGAIAWLPLEQLVQALTELCEQRVLVKAALFEITGMSDIMRGQGEGPGVTATEQKIKASFGSVRMQALQSDFARMASDAQRLKAEVMANFFAPETLIARSNIENTPDAKYAQAAVELIKSKFGMYRIEVKPESVSMADFAAQRSEATEFVTGVSTFLTACAPLVEAVPGSAPSLLELLGLVMARFNGFGNEAEAIIDKAIEQLKQQQAAAAANPQPPPVDPKLEAEKVKQQAEIQKVGIEHAAEMEKLGAEAQLASSQQQSQAVWNVREAEQLAAIKVKEAHAMPPKPAPTGGRK